MKIKVTHPIVRGGETLQAGLEYEVTDSEAQEYIAQDWAVALEQPKRRRGKAAEDDGTNGS